MENNCTNEDLALLLFLLNIQSFVQNRNSNKKLMNIKNETFKNLKFSISLKNFCAIDRAVLVVGSYSDSTDQNVDAFVLRCGTSSLKDSVAQIPKR